MIKYKEEENTNKQEFNNHLHSQKQEPNGVLVEAVDNLEGGGNDGVELREVADAGEERGCYTQRVVHSDEGATLCVRCLCVR